MKIEYVLTEIQELSFEKNITGETQIQIQTKTNYMVYYAEDGKSCIGEFVAEFAPVENPEQLQIKYRSRSLFNIYDTALEAEDKKQIHIEIYNRIFPMCNETIKQFCAMSGAPSISLPMMDMSNMEIIINS